jgi:ABC-type transport system involved in multi-copper enzyme maturation permease subunit
MLGPVLSLELLLGSRRTRAYVFRWMYAGLLLIEVLGLCFLYFVERATLTRTGQAEHFFLIPYLSQHFVPLFVTQQTILLLLAVPVLTAGAVTEEKTTGTLQHLLTTDLVAVEIIVGKLLARLLQTVLIMMAGLPLLAFLGALGGYLEPLTLLGIFAALVMPLLGLAAASLLASVWFKQSREAVLALYAAGAVGYLLVWAAGSWLGANPLSYLDPAFLLEPVWGGTGASGWAEFLTRTLWAGLAWGSLTVICLVLAAWRLRPAYHRQLEQAGRKKPPRWWHAHRPPLSDNPITWRERHVEGLAPSRLLRQVPSWLALLVIFVGTIGVGLTFLYWDLQARSPLVGRDCVAAAVTALASFDILGLAEAISPADASPEMASWFVGFSVAAMLAASLAVGIRCSGVITGEREQKTWEALLLTPLPAKKIIDGKLWGVVGASYLYLLAYAAPLLALALLGGRLCFGETALWVGFTWLAMAFVGATGVWCSMRAKSSWRSLLGTLGIGYVGAGVVYAVMVPYLLPLAGLVALGLGLLLWFVDRMLGTDVSTAGAVAPVPLLVSGFRIASCLALAGLCALLTFLFRIDAIKWITMRERTRSDASRRRSRRRYR